MLLSCFYPLYRRGNILLSIFEKTAHFIGNLGEAVGGVLLFRSKTMLAVGWCLTLWSKLYQEG